METYSWTCLEQSIGKPRLWHTANVNCHGDVLIFGGSSSNILDDAPLVSSDKVILFRTKPFSLERSCLHALVKNRERTKGQWCFLSKPHQTWLQAKDKLLAGLDHAIFRDNVELGVGPSLEQLTVLTAEICAELAMNSDSRYVEYVLQIH